MRSSHIALSVALVAGAALIVPGASGQGAQGGGSPETGFTDTPLVPGTPYHVHDPSRPRPRVITPGAQPGQPPSDAVVLFDGKDLSKWSAVQFATASYKQTDAPAPGSGSVCIKPDRVMQSDPC